MVARLALLLAAAAAHGAPCAAAAAGGGFAGGSCAAGGHGCDHSLLQMERSRRVVKDYPVTDDCASRLNEYQTRPAACLIVNNDQVLLVRVPYSSPPGWDFPGGHEKHHEPACETAEREACEETGHSVRVVRSLTYNVYLCELGPANVCTRSVDEGFLEQQWFSASDLDRITLRPHSWGGDKLGLIRQHLGSHDQSDGQQDGHLQDHGHGATSGSRGADDCGCQQGQEGWSTTYGRCSAGSYTDSHEASVCRRRRLVGDLR